MDDRVGADLDLRIHVGRRRIVNRHAGGHQRLVLCLSHDSTHCREVDAAVDSPNFVGVRDRQRADAEPAPPVERHHVWQVILALRVLRRDAGEGLEQPVKGEGVNASVDFANQTLGRAGVTLFDDTGNFSAGAHDSAIAARLVDDRRHDGRCRSRRFVLIDQCFQRVRGQQRYVA